MRRRTFVAAATSLPALPAAAQSPAWPTQPVRIIVPFAAGGPADLVARTIGTRLSEALGQPVVIEARDGAGGNIGTAVVARAAPDGYTLLLGTNGPLVINVSLMASLPFDPLRDFAPITHLAAVPLYLAVNAAVPANNVAELIAHARSQPGGISYGSSGVGSGGHLAGGLLAARSGAPMTHVPYRGAAPAMTDLIGGRIQFLFVGLPAAVAHVRSGAVRVIAVATPRRASGTPEVPTVAEALPGFQIDSWYGLFAPAGTPRPVIERLNREVARILEMPEVREVLFTRNGLEPAGDGPDAFAATLRREIEEYREIVRITGASQN